MLLYPRSFPSEYKMYRTPKFDNWAPRTISHDSALHDFKCNYLYMITDRTYKLSLSESHYVSLFLSRDLQKEIVPFIVVVCTFLNTWRNFLTAKSNVQSSISVQSIHTGSTAELTTISTPHTFSYATPVVFNKGYAYPRGYAKTC